MSTVTELKQTAVSTKDAASALSAGVSPHKSLSRIHWLLSVQTLVILLGSLNRLGPWTLGYVAANEFLRWVDLHNMLTLPLISVTAFYLLKKEIERGELRGRSQAHLLLNLTFIIGLYLLAVSYGSHETTNYLHARFCPDGSTGDLCRIVIFNDDEFSHWLFFAGFVLVNGALMLMQVVYHWPGKVSGRDTAVLMLNAVFVALGIFANLGFEEIGLDLFVVLGLAALSGWLLWRNGRQPLLVYYAVAYGVGLVLTAVVGRDQAISEWQAEQLVKDDRVSQTLRQVGYQTELTWCQPYHFQPKREGHDARRVILKEVRVKNDPTRKLSLAKGLAVFTPALAIDDVDDTLVYLEMIGAKQSVKANWAALVGGGKVHWLGRKRIRLDGMKEHVKIQATPPCGWANHILICFIPCSINVRHCRYCLDGRGICGKTAVYAALSLYWMRAKARVMTPGGFYLPLINGSS